MAGKAKADTINGQLTTPTITGGTIAGATLSGGDSSGQHVTIPGAPSGATAPTLSVTSSRLALVPDDFKLPADGTDDALSIQRAITQLCTAGGGDLEVLSRHYAWLSAVMAPCQVHVRGRDWLVGPISPSAIAGLRGTWFDIGPAFANTAISPLTFTGANAQGSTLEDVAFSEPGQPAPPAAVTDANGHTTGWNPTTWTPTPYPAAVSASGATDVTFRHIMLDGVYAGLNCVSAGRCNREDIRGQAFSYLIADSSSFDVSRIVDVHEWPFWSSADPVVQYQQANSDVILSFRSDTPMWDRIFGFGVRSCVAVHGVANPDGTTLGGTTTGVTAGTISCDSAKYGIWTASDSTGAQLQVNNLRSYGQKWDQVYNDPVTMIPGSSLVELDGAGSLLQIGQAEDFGTDVSVLAYTSTTGGSNVNIGSLLGILTRMSAGAVLARFQASASAASGTLYIGLLNLTPDAPSGWTLTNTGSNGPGYGVLETPTLTVQH